MQENKRYYWLKLKEDFFEDKQIKYLRSLPSGDALVISYLKMQLKSLKTEGFIKYDSVLPSNIEELALILDEDVNTIKLMIAALQKVNAIEILDDGSFYMLAMQNLIGSEGQSAERVRAFREKNKQKALQCNTDVTKCNTEIDKEIDKDIELDIDIEKEYKKEKKNNKTKKEQEKKIHFAEFVSMTNAEYDKLVSTHGKEFTDQCITILDNYKGSNGKTYKSDYRAILSWVVDKVNNLKPKVSRNSDWEEWCKKYE